MKTYKNTYPETTVKAITNQEVVFSTSSSAIAAKKVYPPGTEITLSYYQEISDLYIFIFPCGNEFMLRDYKFDWVGEGYSFK